MTAAGGGLAGVLGDLGLERATYAGLIRDLAVVDPERNALRFGDDRVSYGELFGRIGAMADHLVQRGVGRGDQVAVMMHNSPDTVVVHLAVQAVGATGALINTAMTGEALRTLLEQSDATVAVVDHELMERVHDIHAAVPKLATIIDGSEPATRDALRGAGDPTTHLDACTATITDPAFVNYTSGTTGLPKGVVLKQLFSAAALVLAADLGLAPGEDRLYLPTPMYHALGLAYTALALRLGDELVIAPRFSASRYWDDIRRYDCTFAYHVGTIARMLYNQPPRPSDGDHGLRVFIGGGMPADIWEDFARRFRVQVFEAYAASDSPGTIANLGTAPVGSIGTPDPGIEVRIVDEHDVEVPVGTPGELQLRPRVALPGPPVEYYGDPEATTDKTRGGWVRTGDLVCADRHANLYFVDRMKDVIRRRGVNIAPAEIERIMGTDTDIVECAALAVPSELGEDDIKLVVVRPCPRSPAEIAARARELLPAHMQPRFVEIVDDLPKTITERVQRYHLKGSWSTPTTWDVEAGAYLADTAAHGAP